MKSAIIVAAVVFLLAGILNAATPLKIQNGQVVFAKCSAEDRIFWKAEDGQNYETAFPTATVTKITPSSTELAISTNAAPFKTYDDYSKCLTKAGLFQKIVEMTTEYQAALATDNDEVKLRYEKLVEIYKGMP